MKIHQLLLLCVAVTLTACIASQPYPEGIPLVAPISPPTVRAPQVGQQWVYEVRNVFNRELVDIVTERVASVGPQVRIERSGLKAGQLPDEIQGPWGYVIQDPFWNPPQRFLQPSPIWPEQLLIGGSGFYPTRYQVVGYPDSSYYWDLNLKAVAWEQIAVPAGVFITLKYQREAPYFQSNDVFRLANARTEDVWLAPETGRWAIRRGYGRYILGGMNWSGALWEDYLEWDLISWK
ncbi:hypothetical protein SAMN06295945_1800 [Polynucleobacter meluiroseus]|uniref:Uncharacterized protein n=1 Tax=Polynucleobacter meluiroseus TaxID=1938814 RepID=A0A240E2D4_9BURK|nr:hypothetical protein [Polynucleobacter meluiroseus]SNX29423.1 hypothetical protein SAMN06295945_1800 [Polynucleobacter meluiroseus]